MDSDSDQNEFDNHHKAKSANEFPGSYKYSHFFISCITYTQIHLSLIDLGLMHPNYDFLIKNYNSIYDEIYLFECEYGRDALVMVPVKIAFDYLKSDKTNREYELLRGFLAIKSLQGNKSMVATHKADIQRRMVGAKSYEVLNHFLNSKQTKASTSKIYKKYTGRYFGDQLIKELYDKRFIQSKITPRGSRLIYLSTQLSMKELAFEIINNKTKKQSNFKADEESMKIQINESLKLIMDNK